MEIETGRGMMRMLGMTAGQGFWVPYPRLSRLRTGRCGSADRGLNCTNRMPGVGGSRNR